MRMPMIRVREMCMRVDQPFVAMMVRVWFTARSIGRVFVLMVLVMVMSVFVPQRFVRMLVFMLLGDVEPNTRDHAKRS